MPPRTSEKMCHLVTVTWWFWRGCSRIVIDLLCFDHHVFGGRPIYVTTPTSWSCIKQECSLHKIVGKPHVECHIISLASWLINDRGIEKADFFSIWYSRWHFSNANWNNWQRMKMILLWILAWFHFEIITLGRFPIVIKTEIRYLTIRGSHNFMG